MTTDTEILSLNAYIVRKIIKLEYNKKSLKCQGESLDSCNRSAKRRLKPTSFVQVIPAIFWAGIH